jgi:hypothetical protein
MKFVLVAFVSAMSLAAILSIVDHFGGTPTRATSVASIVDSAQSPHRNPVEIVDAVLGNTPPRNKYYFRWARSMRTLKEQRVALHPGIFTKGP